MFLLPELRQIEDIVANPERTNFNASLLFAYPLTPAQLQEWAQRVPRIHYDAGQTLFYKDHRPYGVYVLHSGYVELFKEEQESALSSVKPGEMIGLALLLFGETYPYSGRAAEPVEASFIHRNVIEDLIRNNDPLLPNEHRTIYGQMTSPKD